MSESQPTAGQSAQTKVYIATIRSGVCGFVTTVRATPNGRRMVNIHIETTCPNIQKLAGEIATLDAFSEISWRGGSTVYELMAKYAGHASCPVGSGILKAMEVAAGLAVPRNVSIELSVEHGQ